MWNVFYTNKFIPQRFAGYTIGPFVFIRPERKNDIGLLKHELIHVSQFWSTFMTHSFWYFFSKKYRLEVEVEAYREQLRWATGERLESESFPPDTAYHFASFISTKYDLNISQDEAYKLLMAQ